MLGIRRECCDLGIEKGCVQRSDRVANTGRPPAAHPVPEREPLRHLECACDNLDAIDLEGAGPDSRICHARGEGDVAGFPDHVPQPIRLIVIEKGDLRRACHINSP